MKTTVKTPFFVNFCFISLIALGAIAFIGAYEVSHASSLDCTRVFYDSMYREPTQYQKTQCRRKFEYLTKWEIRRMENFILKQK